MHFMRYHGVLYHASFAIDLADTEINLEDMKIKMTFEVKLKRYNET